MRIAILTKLDIIRFMEKFVSDNNRINYINDKGYCFESDSICTDVEHLHF